MFFELVVDRRHFLPIYYGCVSFWGYINILETAFKPGGNTGGGGGARVWCGEGHKLSEKHVGIEPSTLKYKYITSQ